MNVLLVKPGEPPRAMELDGSLSAMQAVVGGRIQAVYPFPEPVALICNDEGKLLHLPFNRCLLLDLWWDCRCPVVITASSLDHSGSQKLACIYEESFPSRQAARRRHCRGAYPGNRYTTQ